MKDMKQETKTTSEIEETEDERYTRLRKERLEWQPVADCGTGAGGWYHAAAGTR